MLIASVVIISILAGVGTILVVNKGDKNYSGSTKKNTTNLTFIYAIVILLSFIALGVYISF
ncbi:hypothetical protein F7731_14210 [Cytobacillus depressus]|uniref:Group-specific protein n=1 Tax=Cytobacillus depressus TaxID=1602942 RepID=A0A6L3VA64_9BACI|nr:hypothetical protein [Cytobacillus depressus]KAB2334905.1 hypothetical protein F7731_14210 [Cytobacillus depressus]